MRCRLLWFTEWSRTTEMEVIEYWNPGRLTLALWTCRFEQDLISVSVVGGYCWLKIERIRSNGDFKVLPALIFWSFAAERLSYKRETTLLWSSYKLCQMLYKWLLESILRPLTDFMTSCSCMLSLKFLIFLWYEVLLAYDFLHKLVLFAPEDSCHIVACPCILFVLPIAHYFVLRCYLYKDYALLVSAFPMLESWLLKHVLAYYRVPS